jgi:hypothetical protein
MSTYATITLSFGQGSIDFNHGLPVVEPLTVTVDEDGSVDFSVVAYDREGDPLSYRYSPPPTLGGIVSGDLPNVNYRPDPDWFGEDNFYFIASDRLAFGIPIGTRGVVRIIVRPVNDPPQAQIGLPNAVTFNGYEDLVVISSRSRAAANVVLDATMSNDVDGDELTFMWREEAREFANTALVTNSFLPGLHEVELLTSDGLLESRAVAVFRVITPSQAIASVQSVLKDSGLPLRRTRPLIAILRNALGALDRESPRVFGNRLENFQRLVDQVIDPIDPDLAAKLNDSVRLIQDAVDAESASGRRHNMGKQFHGLAN